MGRSEPVSWRPLAALVLMAAVLAAMQSRIRRMSWAPAWAMLAHAQQPDAQTCDPTAPQADPADLIDRCARADTSPSPSSGGSDDGGAPDSAPRPAPDSRGLAMGLADHYSEDAIAALPHGKTPGFRVVQAYAVPAEGLGGPVFDARARPHLSTPTDCPLPLALTVLDPRQFPTLSRARKACRKGSVLLLRSSLAAARGDGASAGAGPVEEGAGGEGHGGEALGHVEPHGWCAHAVIARAADRVRPGDCLGKQVRMGGAFYPSLTRSKPPFPLPVVYEDDHFAIVNKPAGVVTYSHRKGGHGTLTVRSALPFVLRPPRPGTVQLLRRPVPVHRLDRATSGLLLVAKTKPALLELSRSFVQRHVQKTYQAVLNGVPQWEEGMAGVAADARAAPDPEPQGSDCNALSGADPAHSPSPSPSPDAVPPGPWHRIERDMDGKHAVTFGRVLSAGPSLKARDGTLTWVEFRPRTGRTHQLRRHSSEVLGAAIVGDHRYDGGGEAAMSFRGQGLFLCSSKVLIPHPYYNTEEGRGQGVEVPAAEGPMEGCTRVFRDADGAVWVRAEIAPPPKFAGLMRRESARVHKFGDPKDAT